jgi:hypothetical protein
MSNQLNSWYYSELGTDNGKTCESGSENQKCEKSLFTPCQAGRHRGVSNVIISELANTPPRTDDSAIDSCSRADIVGDKGPEGDTTKGLGEDIREVVIGRHTLRGDNLLPGIVAADADVLVRLVINGIEHHGDNARVVHEQRNRSMRNLRFQLREQEHHPLGFLGSRRQCGVFGVVGAGSHE